MKTRWMAVGLLCLLLTACGRELIWTEAGSQMVDPARAAEDTPEFPPFDPAPFRVPPVWDTQSAYVVRFVHWTDEKTLQAIARSGSGATAGFSAWECGF